MQTFNTYRGREIKASKQAWYHCAGQRWDVHHVDVHDEVTWLLLKSTPVLPTLRHIKIDGWLYILQPMILSICFNAAKKIN